MKIKFYLLGTYVLFCLFAMFPSHIVANTPNSTLKNYHALLIAVDDYTGKEWSALKNPVRDAEAIKGLLTAKYGFSNVTTLYNEKATRNNIIETIDNITAELSEEDNLLIFYSGHGLLLGSEGYWVPVEANTKERYELVSTTEVKNALGKTRSKHVLMMVDACFSSTIFKSSSLFIKNDGSSTYYNQVDELLSRQAITAGGLEPVPDGAEGEHSIFSKYIIKFLKKNEKDAIDASDLFNMIKFPVAANTPNMPVFGHLQNTGHEGGQFVFRLRKEKICNAKVSFKEGDLVTFDPTGGVLTAVANEADVTFQWTLDSKVLEHQGESLKVTKEGKYGVIVTTKDGECTDAAVADVTIEMPTASLEILEGTNVEFTYKGELNADLTGYNGNVIFEWQKNGFLLGGNEKTITVTESDEYTLTAKLPNGHVLGKVTTKVTIKDRVYTSKLGDNIARISRKFYGSPDYTELIYKANPSVKDQNILRVGTELIIPPKEDKTQSVIANFTLGANKDYAPFSHPSIHKGGILTEIIGATLKEMGQANSVDYIDGRIIATQLYYGKANIGYPVMVSNKTKLLFHFSEPLYKVLQVFFRNADSDIKDIESIMKKRKRKRKYKLLRVATTLEMVSTELEKLAADKQIFIKPYATIEACFDALKKQEVDLVAAPQIAGFNTIQNSDKHQTADFQVLDKAIGSVSLHAAVSKKHPDALILVNQFNKAFTKLYEQGLINKIIDEHIDIMQQRP